MVAAECCDNTHQTDDGARCVDDTYAGAFGCCAYGACNIFCCNCDGGCRRPKRLMARTIIGNAQAEDPTCGLFQTENQCGLDKFEALDTNHDSVITLDEVLAGVNIIRPFLAELDPTPNPDITAELTALFNLYDTNHDGNLTFVEAMTPQSMS